ncbi:MAG: hypothetical protein CVV61_05415 [Tenericutes bacterium HGW-Tenericutes-6]|nr:MAG: hypothetical protein CVV61_05415 [Tenericutes bacterium HGW-Tenericutes-6]
MLILLSPAKTFSKHPKEQSLQFKFEVETNYLLRKLKKLSIKKIENHMKVSRNIAETVFHFYQDFGNLSYEALSLFDGQAFKGLDYQSLDQETKIYAEDKLLIIDALYGLISPHQGISPYRLDMQEKVVGNLYHYWKKPIHLYLSSLNDTIINLASLEYSSILNQDLNMITIDFRQKSKGIIKSISMHTKLARGMMARHILNHRIRDINQLKTIEMDGYHFDPSLSNNKTFIFLKELT